MFVTALAMRCLWYVIMMRLRRGGEYTILGMAKMVTVAFERLGGLCVKTAQIRAMRRDIFPREFCDELSRLHDRAHGFSGEVARQIIEKELGKPIVEVLKDFQTNPVAAASIGQVHIGWLRDNGKKVAVKVQRPTIADAFRKDLAILNGYFFFIRISGFMKTARWVSRLSRRVWPPWAIPNIQGLFGSRRLNLPRRRAMERRTRNTIPIAVHTASR